jgi:hypothetical protein
VVQDERLRRRDALLSGEPFAPIATGLVEQLEAGDGRRRDTCLFSVMRSGSRVLKPWLPPKKMAPSRAR